jgi:hypothetical protein
VLTFFTTAKPFLAHIGIIQRNAIQSWKSLHPEIEIILFGNDQGAAEVSQEFGLRHEPRVDTNELGTKRLDYLFARAQFIARHDLLCYINCDILLMPDFTSALKRVRAAHREFLMVGRRCDADITAPLPFARPDSQSRERHLCSIPRVQRDESPDWQAPDSQARERQSPDWQSEERQAPHWQKELRSLALRSGRKRTAEWIDYFAFTRGLYPPDMPPFVLRVYWDNWLVWKALDSGKPVIDASRAVLAVHQNHDYSHHPQGQQGVWNGEEAGRNAQLAGGWRHLRTIADATQLLTQEGLENNSNRHWSAARRYARHAGRVLLYDIGHPIWFALLGLTRPLRSALRLRPRP